MISTSARSPRVSSCSRPPSPASARSCGSTCRRRCAVAPSAEGSLDVRTAVVLASAGALVAILAHASPARADEPKDEPEKAAQGGGDEEIVEVVDDGPEKPGAAAARPAPEPAKQD